MGLFGFGSNKQIKYLKTENKAQKARIKQLEKLCDEKDSFFKELMSDAMRHGSSLGSKHMSDRKKYLKGE